jgi:hypothetical protein
MRVGDEIALELAEDLRSENEHKDDDLQRARQLDAEVSLHKARQHEQDQHQNAYERALIVFMNDRHDHDADDDQTQDPVDGNHRPLRLGIQILLLGLFQLLYDLPAIHTRYPLFSISHMISACHAAAGACLWSTPRRAAT